MTTGAEAMKEALQKCRNALLALGVGSGSQMARDAIDAANEALASLVEAQPAAVAGEAGQIADEICREVAELPDRNSPEDWPDAMLVTHDELRAIVLGAIASPAAAAGVPEEDAEDAKQVRRIHAENSFHQPACDSSEASGSAIPARPTLPGELKWTDKDGTKHAMGRERAIKVLRELFEDWPGGLDEIESSVRNWRERALAGAGTDSLQYVKSYIEECYNWPGREPLLADIERFIAGGDQKALPPSSVQAVDGDEPTDAQIWALAQRRIGFHQNRPDGRFSAENVDDVEIMSFARDVLDLRAAMKEQGQ